MNYAKFCAIIFATALLYCIAVFALIHLLGEIFGERMNMILGLIACAASRGNSRFPAAPTQAHYQNWLQSSKPSGASECPSARLMSE